MALDDILEKVNEDKISRRGVIKIGIGLGIGIAGASLAGCASPTATPLPTVTPTPAPVLKSSSGVGYLPSDHHAPLMIAAYKGADGKQQSIFEKHGLTVASTVINTGPAVLQQLAGGQIDIGLAGVVPTISAIDNDATIKIVAAVQSNGSGIIVGLNSGIQKIEDLKGKRVAVPSKGSIQDVMLRELFKKYNIDYDRDVTVSAVVVGNQIGAITAGSIDAAITWEPFVSTAVVNNAARVLARSEDIWPDHPCCCINTTTKMITGYADTLKAFFLAMKEANDFIKADVETSAKIVAAAIQGDTEEIEDMAMPHVSFIVKPNETYLAGTETYAATMKSLALTKNDHTRADLFDLTLVNQTL
ncbi:MAG TPA: ABC transporter substrate-binding protein [Methanocella sp.]|nr:ABC transporter substrate-binding protein [Methanocella sp.]